MTEEPIITVRHLSKRFYLDKMRSGQGMRLSELLRLPSYFWKGSPQTQSSSPANAIWALRDVSFDMNRGDRLGIIGKNGAGKTTLLKILSRLLYPTAGEVVLRGRTTALFGVGTGFKPKLTGRENIFHSAALYGLSRKEIRERLPEIIEFSGIERFIDMPVNYYSKGMYARLAFSVAAHLDPEILMLDEVLAGGDIGFQKKCLDKIEGLAGAGRTILFVSHNMNAVIGLCSRCLWIEEGKIVESGEPRAVVQAFSKRMLKLQASYRPNPGSSTLQQPSSDPAQDRGPAGAALDGFEAGDSDGRIKEVFLRDEPIHLKVQYRILRDDIAIVPVIHLHRQGVHVFTSHPGEIVSAPAGSLCTAEAAIPGRFLNTGDYDFSMALVTPARPKWRHVFLENVLSIKIVSEDDAKRLFAGDYQGCVRPDLEWRSSTSECGSERSRVD